MDSLLILGGGTTAGLWISKFETNILPLEQWVPKQYFCKHTIDMTTDANIFINNIAK